MPEQKYDCIVIGSGPGGYVAAIRAAQLGMKTAVVEKNNVGGRCLNEACIPAKAMLRVAEVFMETQHAGDFGIEVEGASVNYDGATKHRDKVVKTLTSGVAMLFDKNKIDYIEGFGSVTDDGNVKIGGQFDGTEIETDRVILAVGSVPKPILDLQFGKRVLDTAGMWLLNEQPKKLCIVGCGASGVEIGSALGRLGTQVTMLEAVDQILPLEDADIAKAAAREIKKQNVRIETGAKVEGAEVSDDGVKVSFNGEQDDFDYLVIAAGRAPDVEGLGLDEAGVERDDRGLIEGGRASAHHTRGRVGDRRHGPGAGAGPQGVRRGDHRGGGLGRPGRASHRLQLHPGRDLLLPAGRLVRTDRGGGEGGRLRRGRREDPDGRRGRPHRLRRPRRDDQDRRRQAVRRDDRRPHRLGEGGRPDPGARERARARGRLLRGRANHPRAPVVRRGGHGGRPGDGRLADSRLELRDDGREQAEQPNHEAAQEGQHLSVQGRNLSSVGCHLGTQAGELSAQAGEVRTYL